MSAPSKEAIEAKVEIYNRCIPAICDKDFKHDLCEKIIQSAIEKATEELKTDLALAKQMCHIESRRANEAESRTAQPHTRRAFKEDRNRMEALNGSY